MADNSVEYEYHWGRIFTVLFIIIALLAGIIYWLNSLDDDSSAPVENTSQSHAEIIKPGSDSDNTNQQKQNPEKAKKPAAATVEENTSNTVNQTANSNKPEHFTNTNNATINEEALKVTSTTVKKSTDKISATVAKIDDATVRNIEQLNIKLYSKQVKRFLLTQGIKNKEPIGPEPSELNTDKNGLITLYAFSEVINLKDQHLEYRWIHRGKTVAKVKVGVWGQKWRSSSSKFVNAQMLGDWQLELRNQNQRLASMTFTIK